MLNKRALLYVGVNLVVPFLFSLAGFIFLILIFQTFKTSEVLFKLDKSSFEIIEFFCLFLVSSLPLLVPFCLLFGILFGYGKMSTDNELTACCALGVSKWQLSLPAFFLGFLVFGMSWTLIHNYGPKAKHRYRFIFDNLKKDIVKTQVQPGVFISENPKTVVYAESKSKDGTLSRIFILDETSMADNSSAIFSASGQFTNRSSRVGLRLTDGEIHQPHENKEHLILKFETYEREIQFGARSVAQKTIGSNTTSQLKALAADKSPKSKMARIEAKKRNVIALIPLFFAAFGVLFGLKIHARSSKGSGFFVSLLIMISFWATLFTSEYFAASLDVPTLVYLPCLVFSCLLLGILYWNRLRSVV